MRCHVADAAEHVDEIGGGGERGIAGERLDLGDGGAGGLQLSSQYDRGPLKRRASRFKPALRCFYGLAAAADGRCQRTGGFVEQDKLAGDGIETGQGGGQCLVQHGERCAGGAADIGKPVLHRRQRCLGAADRLAQLVNGVAGILEPHGDRFQRGIAGVGAVAELGIDNAEVAADLVDDLVRVRGLVIQRQSKLLDVRQQHGEPRVDRRGSFVAHRLDAGARLLDTGDEKPGLLRGIAAQRGRLGREAGVQRVRLLLQAGSAVLKRGGRGCQC